MTKKDDQNLVNLSFSRIETSVNFAGRYCLILIQFRFPYKAPEVEYQGKLF